jgi:hypothetical protein
MTEGKGAKAPKPRDRVRYIGTLGGMHGKEGRVSWIDRKGWIRVMFDGDTSTTKIAECNLAQI